jgi:uncharacterized damage-inducible protein DinB
MNRIILSAIAAALVLAPVQAQQGAYLKEFAKHLAISKQLTIDVANAMPADGYGFKPNPQEMGFGQLMAHIAEANAGMVARVAGQKNTLVKPTDLANKEAVVAYLTDSFDNWQKLVNGLSDADLEKLSGPEGRQLTAREAMWSYFTHTAHHRGQAEVYLRVKNITPPTYKF